MRDRMSEVKKTVVDYNKVHSADVELGGNPASMKPFFDDVSNVRSAINVIKNYISDIDESHQKALTAVSEEQSQEHAKAVDQAMDHVTIQSGVIRKKLKDMEAANKEFQSKSPNSGDARIRVSQHAVLVKKFTDNMAEYNDIQTKYRGKYKQRLQKQFLIVRPEATPDEVEKVVNGEGGTAIFAQQMMPGTQYMEARQALQDIQDRHQDIIKIEKSILELQQLFIDMSVLVTQQGELLNHIDTHVTKAVEYTELGVEEMKNANRIQRRSRKRMCMLIFCLVLLAVCIGLGVGLSSIFRR